jgi:CheY-like chemotaxis protein
MIRNILLAEDERGTALLIKRQLESRGYNVYPASNGIEALKILAEKSVDMIITDVVMPEMDGVDLYEHVKKDPVTASIPIIIVTDKAVFKECFGALGVSHFVEKSSNINELATKIKTVESGLEQAKRYPKVLVSGHRKESVEHMYEIFKQRKCLVIKANDTSEILLKSLFMEPSFIFIDVLFRDNVPANEIIGALRNFSNLKASKIITYAYFQPGELSVDSQGLAAIEELMKQCSKAGADEYIGRFNQHAFVEKLIEYGM